MGEFMQWAWSNGAAFLVFLCLMAVLALAVACAWPWVLGISKEAWHMYDTQKRIDKLQRRMQALQVWHNSATAEIKPIVREQMDYLQGTIDVLLADLAAHKLG